MHLARIFDIRVCARNDVLAKVLNCVCVLMHACVSECLHNSWTSMYDIVSLRVNAIA